MSDRDQKSNEIRELKSLRCIDIKVFRDVSGVHASMEVYDDVEKGEKEINNVKL